MIFAILAVVILFSALVLVHEWGHFISARRNGIDVEEFGLGFPPRIVGRRIGRTIYSINALPLGGFVRLKGEDGADRSHGSFGVAKYIAKLEVLLAGVGMNLLTAYLILLVLCITGLPPIIQNQFSYGTEHVVQDKRLMAIEVAEGSPAASQGIRQGDVILKGNGQQFEDESQLLAFTRENAGKEVKLVVSRDNQTREVQVKLRDPSAQGGFLGVTPLATQKVAYGWASPIVAAGILLQLVWATLAGFGGLIGGLLTEGKVSQDVTGPVGIVVILKNVLNLGVSYVSVFVASISVSLAVVNALLLPALDGGRLALITVQKVLRKPLSAKTEALVHTIGFVSLILLMIVVTYFDIKRFG